MSTFTGSHGRIFHDRWLPDGDVRGTVVLIHGYGEHLGLYDAFAQRLTVHGHAVHALDVAGHGRSDGERAVIGSWDHYVDDARRLLELAREEHPGVPLTVAGHSAGAVTATLLALRSPELVDAVVLSAGPLCPQDWMEAELAAGLVETEAGDPTELLSTHPEYVHALLHDPLTWKGGFRAEMLYALVATWPEIAEGMATGRPAVPVLLVHGEADPVVPVEDSRRVAAQLPEVQVRTFPGDLHDVLNEHDRDTVHEVVAEFLDSVVPSVHVGPGVKPSRAG
ncbi:alpha/beta fold hydrolase [Actinomycetospora lutea]|uniref:alpha/beta fold hydrolase n=1 Tax=Actinomycetospora lutea TaxID=663604 RepID=UPI002366CFA7|nr:alpha/beta fold hydrolase [Actinomycetospora lutea]MDD7942919.1 alpha/beta fold hydrolase [Actinomycetospora lutea]